MTFSCKQCTILRRFGHGRACFRPRRQRRRDRAPGNDHGRFHEFFAGVGTVRAVSARTGSAVWRTTLRSRQQVAADVKQPRADKRVMPFTALRKPRLGAAATHTNGPQTSALTTERSTASTSLRGHAKLRLDSGEKMRIISLRPFFAAFRSLAPKNKKHSV